MNRNQSLIALFAVASLLAGCASNLGGDAYSRDEARREMRIEFATVDSVRTVQIEGTKTAVGSVAGAAIGGVAGSSIGGGGKSSTVGAVVGAVVGGVAGSAVEEVATRRQGIEITLKLDNGEYRAIVQQDEGENFQPGERVRLIKGSATRVAR
ncbi:MAG: glycine zipper 2TM domain-containing protein [Zoogloeaceae bacterium]|jgi:outer membrane lipoprotein SlyB|nr:glycine zipper 2TM domain-containing protein [Zoogloeaceae bacterium]